MISSFEFAGEFSEMISQGRDGLAGSMREDDGIRVEVQHLFGFDSTEAFSVESSPTRGETGHEDVDIDLNGICLLDVFVDHFDHLVVHSFLDSVILDVLTTLVFVVAHPVGPTAGLLFDFQKRVDVRGEHVIGIAGEVPRTRVE